MSVSGLCEICEARTVVDACDRCGRVVCEVHFDEETGLCTDCLREVGPRPDDGTPGGERDRPDGVDEYQF